MAKGNNGTKAEEAYNLLKSKLLAGEFDPGEQLTEPKVIKLCRVGRSPVREALHRLEAEGLISNRGAYKSKYVGYIEDEDPKELLYRCEMRDAIATQAARLAAKNMNGWQVDELRRLEQVRADAIAAGDRPARHQAAIEFNRYLVANCGNPLLQTIWETYGLMQPMARSLELEQKFIEVLEPADYAHWWLPVVEAIAARDADEAGRRMLEICSRSTEAVRKALWDALKQPLNHASGVAVG